MSPPSSILNTQERIVVNTRTHKRLRSRWRTTAPSTRTRCLRMSPNSYSCLSTFIKKNLLTPLVSRFAEPERVTSPQSPPFPQTLTNNHPQKRTPTAPAQSPPPLNIQKQHPHPAARHSPSHHYDKPAPPLPRNDRDYHPSGGSGSGSGSSSRPIPSPRDDRHYQSSTGGAPQGPVSQPTGNFTYGQSPPQDRRLDSARDGRDGRDRDGRDTRGHRGPASPALTGEDPNLLPLFRAVDKDGMSLQSQPRCLVILGEIAERRQKKG